MRGVSLRSYAALFWDFDGVIKDSVDAKGVTFEKLFEPFGRAVATRVRAHHESHGGMSRFEKIPLYLEWAGCAPSDEEVARYCGLFSAAVRQAVIDSAWVPGAREYLHSNHARQFCALVSATPQTEIEEIVQAVGLDLCFREVCGAPIVKAAAISAAMTRLGIRGADALMIGDSSADYEAARSCGIGFLLRRTALNRDLQSKYRCAQCDNFAHDE
jgi:phosphoglycolate phosphatase-like HAD superfamily hydrolase